MPIFLHHAQRHPDGLFRFNFAINPIDTPHTVESDTQYAYLPPEVASHFVLRKWGRPLTDEEAAGINDTTVPVEPDMTAEDKVALAELEAEARTTPKAKPARGK